MKPAANTTRLSTMGLSTTELNMPVLDSVTTAQTQQLQINDLPSSVWLLCILTLMSALTACQSVPNAHSPVAGAISDPASTAVPAAIGSDRADLATANSTAILATPAANLPTTSSPATPSNMHLPPGSSVVIHTPRSTPTQAPVYHPIDKQNRPYPASSDQQINLGSNNPLTQPNTTETVSAGSAPATATNQPLINTNTPSASTAGQTTADVLMIDPMPAPSSQDLLQRARQNTQQSTPNTPASSLNDTLPAFQRLMNAGVSQLQAGRINDAENSFTRAQRLAPQSSAVYFYLGQVAIKKNQPRKAEAMARRGLAVSQDATRRQQLWQLILLSGQMQNDVRVINEAKQALTN